MSKHNINVSKPWYKKVIFFWEWNIFEKLLLGLNFSVTLAFLIFLCIKGSPKDWTIWVSFIGSFVNIVSVILATKKRVSCFAWGIVAVVLFGAIAWDTHAFGNMVLYWGFYIPAQIVAWVLWYRSSDNKVEIKPRGMKWWYILIAVVVTAGLIVGFTFVEQIHGFQSWWFGDDKGYTFLHSTLDSAILMMSLTMTIFAWLRFRERWMLSILIDSVQTVFWIILAIGVGRDAESAAWIMMVSSLSMLVAAVYGVINWRK